VEIEGQCTGWKSIFCGVICMCFEDFTSIPLALSTSWKNSCFRFVPCWARNSCFKI